MMMTWGTTSTIRFETICLLFPYTFERWCWTINGVLVCCWLPTSHDQKFIRGVLRSAWMVVWNTRRNALIVWGDETRFGVHVVIHCLILGSTTWWKKLTLPSWVRTEKKLLKQKCWRMKTFCPRSGSDPVNKSSHERSKKRLSAPDLELEVL